MPATPRRALLQACARFRRRFHDPRNTSAKATAAGLCSPAALNHSQDRGVRRQSYCKQFVMASYLPYSLLSLDDRVNRIVSSGRANYNPGDVNDGQTCRRPPSAPAYDIEARGTLDLSYFRIHKRHAHIARIDRRGLQNHLWCHLRMSMLSSYIRLSPSVSRARIIAAIHDTLDIR